MTAREAAEELDIHPGYLLILARRMGLGTKMRGRMYFSELDIAELKGRRKRDGVQKWKRYEK